MPFAIIPGRCFWIVYDDYDGKPRQCPNPVRSHGDFLDANGARYHGAEACADHERELVEPRFRRKQQPPG